MQFSRQYSRLFVTLRDDFSRTSGRCVIELRNGIGRLSCVIQGIKTDKAYRAVLVKSGNDVSIAVPVGIIANDGIRGNSKFEFNPDNIFGSGININEIDAVSINDGNKSILCGFIDKRVDFENNMRIFSNDDCFAPKETEESESETETETETEGSEPETEDIRKNMSPTDELIEMLEKFRRNINELECFTNSKPKINDGIGYENALEKFCRRSYPLGKEDKISWYETNMHFIDRETAINPLFVLGYKKYGYILCGTDGKESFTAVMCDKNTDYDRENSDYREYNDKCYIIYKTNGRKDK